MGVGDAAEVPGRVSAAVVPPDEHRLPELRRVENTPTITLTNAQVAPSLGRNLAQCGVAATCTATVTVQLEPPGSMYEDRLQQVDVRFSRTFRVENSVSAAASMSANLFNASNVLNLQRQFGATYLNVLQIMGGRLVKLGVQVDS